MADQHPDHAKALERATMFRAVRKTDDEIRRALVSAFPDYSKHRKDQGLDVLPFAAAPTTASPQSGRAGTLARKTVSEVGVTATYRFVPVGKMVVPAEPAVQESTVVGGLPSWRARPINDPKPEGYCAEIIVSWEAESPLLVGEPANDVEAVLPPFRPGGPPEPTGKKVRHVVPAFFGDAKVPEWIIPGSTLRGMLRSAVETIGFARLTQFNRHRYFPLRNFDHASYGQGFYPIMNPNKLAAGWLRIKPNSEIPASNQMHKLHLQLCPMGVAGWNPVFASHLLPRLGYYSQNRPDMRTKYAELGMVKGNVFDFTMSRLYRPADDDHGKPSVVKAEQHEKDVFRGVPVCSNASPKQRDQEKEKKREYIFRALPDDAEWLDLPPGIVAQFVELNSTRVDEKLEPVKAWNELLPTLREGMIVPVFYVGNPADPLTMTQVRARKQAGLEPFAMGLTRLFRAPHEYEFLEAVENAVGPTLPRYMLESDQAVARRDPLDIAEALFGYVYEPEDVLKISKEAAKAISTAPGDFALKGRVSFSAARLAGPQPVKTPPQVAVLAAPKPSFAPLYLAGTWKDYSPPAGAKPEIAGRKAYLPRYPSANAKAALDGVTEALRGTVLTKETSGEKGWDKGKSKTWSALSFLVPATGQKLVFESRIRLFNVTEVEIGAVLWALTHGGQTDKYRHMIGHARSLGAGQVRIAAARLAIDSNKGDERSEDVAHVRFLDAFAKYMEGKLGDRWLKSPTMIDFLKAADPAVGQKQNQWLSSMALSKFSQARGITQPLKPKKNDNYVDPIQGPLLPL